MPLVKLITRCSCRREVFDRQSTSTRPRSLYSERTACRSNSHLGCKIANRTGQRCLELRFDRRMDTDFQRRGLREHLFANTNRETALGSPGQLPPRLSAREVQTCMAENHRPVRERGSFCRTSMSSHGSRRSAHSRLSDCFHPSYSAGGITIRKLRIWLWPRPHNSAQAISYCPGRST